MNTIRVALLASGDLWAGAEVMVYHLVAGLFEKEDVDILVILMNRGKLANELGCLGVDVQIVDESERSLANSIGLIRKLIKGFKPNIIHSHRYKENLLAWFGSLGTSGCKLIATQHGMPEAMGALTVKDRLRTNFFFRLLSTGFARTITVSEDMRWALVGRYGFSESDVNVIHNGITTPRFVIARSRGRMVVGSAGRLFPVKDFSLLVDVAKSVVRQNNTIDFVLAGDGPERLMLEKKVERYGLGERFKFLGQQDDINAFYRGIDLYINTSVHEGIPISLLEAMSYGLPAVVPMVGGFSEIVRNGIDAYLVESRDPDAFARRIFDLMSPEKRAMMGCSARGRVIDSFSREAMTQKYYQLYKELVLGN